MRLIAAALVALAVSACSTTPVTTAYRADAGVTPLRASGPIAVGTFADERGEGPKWLGAIRGGFGNPLKVLEAEETVSNMVRKSFEDALRARGAATGGAPKYQVRGLIKKLDCSQYVRREAHAVIEVSVIDSASGRELFRATYTADQVQGSAMALDAGIFASVDDLRKVFESTLKEVVDKALDDSRLRAAIT